MVFFFVVPSLLVLFSDYSGLLKSEVAKMVAWPVTLVSFSLILGVATFVRYHLTQVFKRSKQWQYSSLALVLFLLTFVLALVAKPIYDYVVTNVVVVLQISMTAFVGFYLFTLFFRAAHIRTTEVGIMLGAAAFVMLWMAPVGYSIWQGLPIIGKWINDIPNAGAQRGMLIVIAVGTLGLFVRSLLGYEKSYSGG